jgi:hypothetical protein
MQSLGQWIQRGQFSQVASRTPRGWTIRPAPAKRPQKCGTHTPDETMKLTPDEIRLVVFILLALVVGAAVKNYRHRQQFDLPPPPARVAPATPSPADYE